MLALSPPHPRFLGSLHSALPVASFQSTVPAHVALKNQQKSRNPLAGSLAKIPLRGPGTRHAGSKQSHARLN